MILQLMVLCCKSAWTTLYARGGAQVVKLYVNRVATTSRAVLALCKAFVMARGET
jgi:hypothetical protein